MYYLNILDTTIRNCVKIVLNILLTIQEAQLFYKKLCQDSTEHFINHTGSTIILYEIVLFCIFYAFFAIISN